MSRTFHMVSALVTGLVLLAPGVAAASEGPAPTPVIQNTSLIVPAVIAPTGPPQTTVSATLRTVPEGQPVPNQLVRFSFSGSGAPEGCQATTDGQGVASCPVTFTLPATLQVTAEFAGVPNVYAPISATASAIITLRPLNASAFTVNDRGYVGDTITASSLVSDSVGRRVPFHYVFTLTGPAGEQDIRSGDGLTPGDVEETFSFTRRGVHQLDLFVQERFPDGSLRGGTSASKTITVYQRTELSVADLSGPPGAPLTASATLHAVEAFGITGPPVPDQLVSFSFTGSGAPGDCQAMTDAQGVARCPVTFTSRGRYTAKASFANAADFFEGATASREVAIGATAPTIAPLVTGTLGTDGWYTSNVNLGWSVSEELFPETLVKSGCGDVSVTSDQPATDYTCSASSAGGSAQPVTVTIKRDATNPTVTYANNAGSYGLQDTVAITCAAADNLSGLASTTCTNTQDAAWTLGPGEHTLSATATDAAGNVGSNSTRFTVVVTPASLCQLTTQLVKGSPAYLALTPKEQKTLDKRAEGLCAKLVRIVPKLSPSEKAQLVSAVKDEIQSLVPTWLTQDQANKLKTLADAL